MSINAYIENKNHDEDQYDYSDYAEYHTSTIRLKK